MTVDILLHQAAHERVRDRLTELNLPIRLLVLDDKGAYSHQGQPVTLDTCAPEVAWLSLDMAASGLFNATLDAILAQPAMKWVQTFNAGLDNPRYKEFAAAGIRVSKSSAQAVAISEYTFAHILSLFQPLQVRRQAQTATEWRRTPFREIWRTTWLVIGFGNIGEEIARRARAFDARVLAVRRSGMPSDLASEMGTMADLPKFLPQADIVVLACALNAETRHMADADFFRHLKSGAVLVNVARGGLIDDTALIAALDRGAVATAVLDVFDPEPLPATNPYWTHPKVELTAHTSFAGNGTKIRGDELFLANLPRYIAGEALFNEADQAELLGA